MSDTRVSDILRILRRKAAPAIAVPDERKEKSPEQEIKPIGKFR